MDVPEGCESCKVLIVWDIVGANTKVLCKNRSLPSWLKGEFRHRSVPAPNSNTVCGNAIVVQSAQHTAPVGIVPNDTKVLDRYTLTRQVDRYIQRVATDC